MGIDEKKWSFTEKELKNFLDSIVEKYTKSFDSTSCKSIEEREIYEKLKMISARSIYK